MTQATHAPIVILIYNPVSRLPNISQTTGKDTAKNVRMYLLIRVAYLK